MQSAWDASAKYKYSEHSTIHNPQEIGADGNIHTWTLELNGQYFRVTREVWEAYHKDNAALLRQYAGTESDAAALAEWEAANK